MLTATAPVTRPIINGSFTVATCQAHTPDGTEAGWVEVYTRHPGTPEGITVRPALSLGPDRPGDFSLPASATLDDALAALEHRIAGCLA